MGIELDDWREGDQELVAVLAADGRQHDGYRAFLWDRQRVPPLFDGDERAGVDSRDNVSVHVVELLEKVGLEKLDDKVHIFQAGKWLGDPPNDPSVAEGVAAIKQRYEGLMGPDEWLLE